MNLGTDEEKKAFLDRLWELYQESLKTAPVRYALSLPEIKGNHEDYFVKAWPKYGTLDYIRAIHYVLKMFHNRLWVYGLDPKEWAFDIVGDFEGFDEEAMNEWLSVRHVPLWLLGKRVIWIHPRKFPSQILGLDEELEIDLDEMVQKLPWLNAYIYLDEPKKGK